MLYITNVKLEINNIINKFFQVFFITLFKKPINFGQLT
jgi:hypothetical protein